jgi:hypothetical protein
MDKREIKIYFAETKNNLQDLVSSGDAEIIIEYTGNEERQTALDITFKCIKIPSLNVTETFHASKNNRRHRKKFVAPRQFDAIDIDVDIEEKAGLFRTGTGIGIHKTLTIRMTTTKSYSVSESTEMQGLIDQMVKLEEPLVLVPEVENLVEIQPIVGDVTTTPKISMEIASTIGLPIKLVMSNKELRTVLGKTQEAIDKLDNVIEDQIYLQYFVSALKNHIEDSGFQGGIEVEAVGDAHIKVNSMPVWYYYATQITPSEDTTINEKITNVIALANKSNAFVTVLVSSIDDILVKLSQEKHINVVDVFHGVELHGVMIGDPTVKEFIEDKLGLELTPHGTNPEGTYTPSLFKEKLDKVKK